MWRRLARPCRWCRERRRLLLLPAALLLVVGCGALLLQLPGLGRLHQHVRSIGRDLLLPPPPPELAGGGRVRVADDRERLYIKAKSATESGRPLARPRNGGEDLPPVDEAVMAARGLHPVVTGGEDSDPVMQFRRRKIQEMMQHAWNGYSKYAWGWNELRPVSLQGHAANGIFGGAEMGATIVDSLDTLFIMGMKEEFADARQWVKDKLDITQIATDVSVFEVNIRYVGGLLSIFALTGDALFLDRAVQTARALLPAFSTLSGLPQSLVVPATGKSHNYGWTAGASSILSEVGTLHMEFAYLSDVSGEPVFRRKVQRVRQVLRDLEKPGGLYPFYINPRTGHWAQLGHVSVGALGDSFYEYLLKEWLRSGREDTEALHMYREAISSITDRLLKKSRVSGLAYVAELHNERPNHVMDHLACFIGGLYALGAARDRTAQSQRHIEIGAELTSTCHQAYNRTATKLGPEKFWFTDSLEARAVRNQERYYILRPEVIESYFVLWRVTGDPKYREWGWEAAQAIEQFCRVEGGYSGIKDVDSLVPQHDDVQQSFFLAETLKYLYLLFSDSRLLSLDEWVFNTEAHPLPIKGANQLYRLVGA